MVLEDVRSPIRSSGLTAFSIASARHAWLYVILLAAAVAGVAFSTGPFGSDDTVYLGRALEVSEGVFTPADYNGALRYGYNLPAGMIIAVFGLSYWSASLLPFLASLGEIILVYWFAMRAFSRRVAALSAAMLAFLPLHIHLSSRIHTDAMVAAAMTVTFVAFWAAENSRNRQLYFLSGIAAGFVFFIKELVIVFLAVFVIYLLWTRRWDWRWLWAGAGGAVMLGLHLALNLAISGDPLQSFNVFFAQINADFIGGDKETTPWYYFNYLFFDLRWTLLLGWLALLGLVFWALQNRQRPDSNAESYVVFWGVGLLIVFSFTPISLSPFQFITKQSNYLNLFFAPLALLAGLALDRLWRLPRTALIAAAVAGGIVLAGVGQQTKRVFVANSDALATLAAANPDTVFYGSTNNRNFAALHSMLAGGEAVGQVRALGDMPAQLPPAAGAVFAVLDRQTHGWGALDPSMSDLPPGCWRRLSELRPAGYGLGWHVTHALAALPVAGGHFASFLSPQPATLYVVPRDRPWCTDAVS